MPHISDTDPWPAAKLSWWAKYPVWTLSETAALLLAREPHRGDRPDAGLWVDEIERAYPGSAAIEDYWRLIRLLEAVIENGDLAREEQPATILRWADRMEISYPEELKEALRHDGSKPPAGDPATLELRQQICNLFMDRSDLNDAVDDLRRENVVLRGEAARKDDQIAGLQAQIELARPSEDAAAGSVSFRTLQRMVLAMAVKKYQYDPRDNKSPSTTNIVSATEQIGERVGPDSVRKALTGCVEALSWTPVGDVPR